jgi:dTDP-4-amino-4,6-dideoxygalactose transaminase
MWKIPLFKLNYDQRERDAAAAVIDSGWLTMGERVVEFESAFAEYLGQPRVSCTAVSSGTAALHLALLALGVGPGDEVIIPALTFVADANVVAVFGATPVLADCASLDDWNCTAADIEARISPRTRAVLIMHYAGYPCDMAGILDLCARHRLPLVEDVAHAPGGADRGQCCGTFGDITCFSFFSNKNLSIGEGGLVATKDPGLHQRLRYLRSHGMTTLTLDRHQGRAISYDVMQPGLNYRMDEIHAALGLAQLAKLPAGNQRRAELTAAYRRRLAGSGGRHSLCGACPRDDLRLSYSAGAVARRHGPPAGH